jgi:putative pyruvate formate lyase activating enzyme
LRDVNTLIQEHALAMNGTERIDAAFALLESCTLCPRRCGSRRLAGEKGACGAGADLLLSSAAPHFGEERELVMRGGSGTIFLAGCNLGCLFCQNHDISHIVGEGAGVRAVTAGETADVMLSLQAIGCHNINFVTPTHFTPQIMEAIASARRRGLTLPVVYNCGGYESVETLELLEGFVQIYMPDLKFTDPAVADQLAGAPDYPARVREAIREMHHQVGDLENDRGGAARRGLLVRHLVMPGGLAGTAEAMRFLAEEISPNTRVNIMDQYRPCFRATEVPGLARRATGVEYAEAVAAARRAGLLRAD